MAFTYNKDLIMEILVHFQNTTPDQLRKEFDLALERIKKLGERHWPPQTKDENFVSLYRALIEPVGPSYQ
jgi:hypothetical protein